MKARRQPASIHARLDRIEAVVRPFETYAERYCRELENQWILTVPEAADLLAEYLDEREAHCGAFGLLQTAYGRDLTLRIMDSLYAQSD